MNVYCNSYNFCLNILRMPENKKKLFPLIVTKNKLMRDLLKSLDKIKSTDCSVLLIGETGVGKELIAEYIHQISCRANNPFIKISLSAIPSDLIESELFGHVKGAFTSAFSEKKGLFELANTGSMLLDDIDDVPLQIQTKLLRVLETKKISKIGSSQNINIDVRIITASKYDLKELVNKEKFRSDLYYRLNVVPFFIPPLRERKEDISPLIHHFIKYYKPENLLKISPEVVNALNEYNWPGNVRELRNVIQRLTIFSNKEVQLSDLPDEIRNIRCIDKLLSSCINCCTREEKDFNQMMQCLEHNLINEAMNKSNGNQLLAAKKLKLSPTTFRDKLKKYNSLNLKNSTK